MPDLIYLMNSLTNNKGEILIEGLLDDVAPVTDTEKNIYKDIKFDVGLFREEVGTGCLRHAEAKVSSMSLL